MLGEVANAECGVRVWQMDTGYESKASKVDALCAG